MPRYAPYACAPFLCAAVVVLRVRAYAIGCDAEDSAGSATDCVINDCVGAAASANRRAHSKRHPFAQADGTRVDGCPVPCGRQNASETENVNGGDLAGR